MLAFLLMVAFTADPAFAGDVAPTEAVEPELVTLGTAGGRPNTDGQLFGGVPSALGSAQTYQSARELLRFWRLVRNQSC